jgi:PII-like signaling protein
MTGTTGSGSVSAPPRRLAVVHGSTPDDVGGPRRRTARRITVIVDGSAVCDGVPLAVDIVARAHAAGLPGVSVFRGIGGTSPQAPDDQSFMIVMVADPESADDLVRQIAPLLDDGLLVTDDVVEIVHDRAGER